MAEQEMTVTRSTTRAKPSRLRDRVRERVTHDEPARESDRYAGQERPPPPDAGGDDRSADRRGHGWREFYVLTNTAQPTTYALKAITAPKSGTNGIHGNNLATGSGAGVAFSVGGDSDAGPILRATGALVDASLARAGGASNSMSAPLIAAIIAIMLIVSLRYYLDSFSCSASVPATELRARYT